MNFFRRLLPYLTVALVSVAIYDGVTFYLRWKSIHDEKAQELAAAQEDAKKTIDMLGGNQLKILTFYASPRVLRPGQSTSMCYGVNAAAKVSIAPAVNEIVYPAYSRCLQVSPAASTEYTLTAEDDAGHQVQRKVAIKVIR